MRRYPINVKTFVMSRETMTFVQKIKSEQPSYLKNRNCCLYFENWYLYWCKPTHSKITLHWGQPLSAVDNTLPKFLSPSRQKRQVDKKELKQSSLPKDGKK